MIDKLIIFRIRLKKKKVIYLYVVVWVINISCLEEKENLRKTITL